MHSNLPRISLIIYIFIQSALIAQFGKVEVTFDDRLLKVAERQELIPLKSQIASFFYQNNWDEEYSDLQIPLYIQIIFEGTAPKGAALTYMGQALFSNGVDQRYFDKGLQFIYSSAGSIYYDPVIFDPLASFLAYYANLILAAEMDTYSPSAGNRVYEIARAIALRGQDSDYSRGWSERRRVEALLSSNRGLRKVRFATYYGIELFHNNRPEEAVKQFKEMIAGLDEVHSRSPREHYTMLFMNGHAEELTKILIQLRQKNLLQNLVYLDSDNRTLYEDGISVISP
jgi:hypothetical protein